MSVQYYCSNKNCSYPGQTRFQMSFKTESIIDSNNLAAAFCPFCKSEMKPDFVMDAPKGGTAPDLPEGCL